MRFAAFGDSGSAPACVCSGFRTLTDVLSACCLFHLLLDGEDGGNKFLRICLILSNAVPTCCVLDVPCPRGLPR
jgi:hypothetical protein